MQKTQPPSTQLHPKGRLTRAEYRRFKYRSAQDGTRKSHGFLENGTDVNYLSDKEWAEEARPALFDAVNAAVWNMRGTEKTLNLCILNGNTQKRNLMMRSHFLGEC